MCLCDQLRKLVAKERPVGRMSLEPCQVEVFMEDPRPEDQGPVRVRVYILNGQPGLGQVPIYYFGSWVFLTSVSVSMRVFCNLQFVKLGWEKCEQEIRWEKKHALPQPPETEHGRN